MTATRPFSITTVLLLLTVGVIWWTERPRPEGLAMQLETIDANIAGWTMVQSGSFSELVLDRLRPTAYLTREYQKNSQHLTLMIAYYAQQRAGESMHSPKNCLPGSGWEIDQRQPALVQFGGKPIEINQLTILNGGQRMLVYYWYQSRQRVIASEYLGKILLAHDSILNQGTAGSIVRIVLPDTPQAIANGREFAAEVMRQLQRCLGV